MNKQDILTLVKRLIVPALLLALGAILIVNPDAASVLIARLLGWALILGAVVCGLSAIITRHGQVGKGIAAVILAIAGGWICANPLALTAWIIRIIGALILLNSVADLSYAKALGRVSLLSVLSAIVGGVLLLLPISTSRLIISLCGIVVALIGAAMLVIRLRSQARLTLPEDPDIIDAL